VKHFISLIIFVTAIATTHVSMATSGSLAEQRVVCFAMHKNLMDKPALRNAQACWRAHAYLMARG
jgi:hypothetical protein